MLIILFGPPGAGKGTQAAKISSLFSFKALSTGDILRAEISAKTKLGRKIQHIVESGDLVDDELIIELVESAMKKNGKKNYILDGFPRTLIQAKKFDEALKKSTQKISCVIELEVNKDRLLKRLVNRFSCKNCGANYNKLFKMPKIKGVCDKCGGTQFETRPDDNEQVITNRFDEYQKLTSPILPYYKEQGILHKIDGNLEASSIFEQIVKILKNVLT
ncbi:MAG: adenylate kinase [Rickettsiales bacterium]